MTTPDLSGPQAYLLLALAGGAELRRLSAGDFLHLTNGLGRRLMSCPEDADALSRLGLIAIERKAGEVWAEITPAGVEWAARELAHAP